MKYRKIEIKGNEWDALHDLEKHVPFCLHLNQSTNQQIAISDIKIGEFSENSSLPQKTVMHEFMDIVGYSAETKSVIPFGPEPKIKRNFEYLPHIIKVTTDVHVPRTIAASNFEIDSLQIQGDWKKYALIDVEKPEKKIKWTNLTQDILYESEQHFHILLLEAADGTRLEVGAGFDLFRWHLARKNRIQKNEEGEAQSDYVKPKGKFTITSSKDALSIRRQVMSADQEFEICSQNWRFNWYLAWGKKKKSEDNIEHPPAPRLWETSPTSNKQCMHAKTTRNQFRKALRGMINKVSNETIIINVAPQFCTNSSHVAKPGQKDCEHWDLSDIIDYWFWANKQLLPRDSRLIIRAPKDSIFKECPSFWSMGHELPSFED